MKHNEQSLEAEKYNAEFVLWCGVKNHGHNFTEHNSHEAITKLYDFVCAYFARRAFRNTRNQQPSVAHSLKQGRP